MKNSYKLQNIVMLLPNVKIPFMSYTLGCVLPTTAKSVYTPELHVLM